MRWALFKLILTILNNSYGRLCIIHFIHDLVQSIGTVICKYRLKNKGLAKNQKETKFTFKCIFPLLLLLLIFHGGGGGGGAQDYLDKILICYLFNCNVIFIFIILYIQLICYSF